MKDGSHLGRDEYPKSVASVFDLLNRSSGQLEGRVQRTNRNNNNRGSSFLQSGENNDSANAVVAGTDGRTLEHIVCYNCDHHGHYSGQCLHPDRRQRGWNSV